jgi:hypothetical protein
MFSHVEVNDEQRTSDIIKDLNEVEEEWKEAEHSE